jgi:hypothetical protein
MPYLVGCGRPCGERAEVQLIKAPPLLLPTSIKKQSTTSTYEDGNSADGWRAIFRQLLPPRCRLLELAGGLACLPGTARCLGQQRSSVAGQLGVLSACLWLGFPSVSSR